LQNFLQAVFIFSQRAATANFLPDKNVVFVLKNFLRAN
jgi:hypothetical protein